MKVDDRVECFTGACKGERGYIEKIDLSRNYRTIYVQIEPDGLNPGHKSGWCDPECWRVCKEDSKMTKFYRVKKDNFMYVAGAILKLENYNYVSITDLWNVHEDQTEFLTPRLVEKSPEWFERVYEVSDFGKAKYVLKEKAQEIAAKFYKD